MVALISVNGYPETGEGDVAEEKANRRSREVREDIRNCNWFFRLTLKNQLTPNNRLKTLKALGKLPYPSNDSRQLSFIAHTLFLLSWPLWPVHTFTKVKTTKKSTQMHHYKTQEWSKKESVFIRFGT